MAESNSLEIFEFREAIDRVKLWFFGVSLSIRRSVSIDFTPDREFYAQIKSNHDCCSIGLSLGILFRLDALWKNGAPRLSDQENKQRISSYRHNHIENSLKWLILHELNHIELGHFEFAACLGISKRTNRNSRSKLNISQDLRFDVLPSLEMQADHVASELLLGAYSADGWPEMRQKIIAISSMIVLIEREEAKLEYDERTHPKAATRIFQLLCHVAEMPLVSAHLLKDANLLPAADEIEWYGKEVTLPCYFDAVHLAEVAGAESIKADLGNPEDFFADMAIVKLGDPSRYSDLKTEGAKEWALLWEYNQALKPLQSGVYFAN